jgi:AraC-like DNA-binding protein
MTGRLAIVRAAHLMDYLAVMREAGIPVDRDLARSSLPPRIEETPDLYLSIPMALDWIARCGHDIEPMHLGFLAARHASMASLQTSHTARILAAPTGLMRLARLIGIANREDNVLYGRMTTEGNDFRMGCDMAGLGSHPFFCFAEWLNQNGIIAIVRSVAGSGWCPRELTFQSKYPPSLAARAAFPDTRMLIGRKHTTVLIDAEALARPAAGAPAGGSLEKAPQDAEEQWTFATLLRSAILPYFNGAHPDLALAAEIAGMSRRSLQRTLRLSGQSFSDVLQEARFEYARNLLADRSAKIIDVAMMLGYGSPQHFSRAFRRYTGVTPTSYRRAATVGE